MATIMFKKPKRNFRKKVSDIGSDEDHGADNEVDMETEDVPSTIVKSSQEKKKKIKPKESSKSSSVLSFQMDEDNEEDGYGEVFKVKKSSHSRRIAKQLKKDKQRQDKETKNGNSGDAHSSEEEEKNDHGRHSKSKRNENESRRRRKDAENEGKLAEEKLKQLRDEFRTLNGEEAEALDDSDEDDVEKAFKNRLARGEIPDAKTIHFIRKQRQMARETDNFIPIEQEKTKPSQSTQRLVREDDNDKSDDDEDDPHRIEFSLNQAARERQQIRDDFLAAEQGSGEDSDQEREWEKQQIKKAVSYQIPGVEIAPEINSSSSNVKFVDSSRPRVPAARDSLMDSKPFSALSTSKDSADVTIEAVRKRLEERLSVTESVYRTHNIKLKQTLSDLTATEESEASCRKKAPKLESQYRFFQELRGYVQDLVECLNEKVLVIQALEKRSNNILKSRALRLVQRRQQDIKDQCRDYMTSKASVTVDTEVVEENPRQRRTADREARRARRRRLRESKNIQGHHDGLSSDDEDSSQSQVLKYQSEIDEIYEAQSHLFDDVVEEFSQMEVVKEHFEKWKFNYSDSYKEAYIGLCAPKILNPFIRKDLLLWNPLNTKCMDFEDSHWYNTLVFMGFREGEEEMDRSDDDYRILPSILEKIILPKLSFLVENVWDPLSSTQTARLVNLTLRLTKDYPNVHAGNKNFKVLLQSVVNRLQRTLDDDIFMPMYPLSALDNRSSGPSIFFHRQSWTCIKLLGNILSWNRLIAESVLQKLAFSGLLNRYIVLSLVSSHINKEALQKCQHIISTLPKEWFEKLEGDATLPQLENLSRYLVSAAETLHKATALEADKERLGGRELVKQITKHLVNIHAMDHAMHLAIQFSFPLNSC